jgi:tellurite methyltransferase
MIRTIDGFHQDDLGDWVAELSCLHGQHVRHRPPFQERPWVQTPEGRLARIGSELDCPLCDRAELPDDLELARTAGPFDEATLPAALQRDHRVGARTWGRLGVLAGSVGFTMETNPPLAVELSEGETQAIPPGVAHAVHVQGPVRLQVEFLVTRPV